MAIRMSGMISGMDTEALVSAMVSTYVERKQKYQKAQTLSPALRNELCGKYTYRRGDHPCSCPGKGGTDAWRYR